MYLITQLVGLDPRTPSPSRGPEPPAYIG